MAGLNQSGNDRDRSKNLNATNLPAPLSPLQENRRELIATLNLLDETLETVVRADLASELVGICSRYEDVKERVVYPALRTSTAAGHEVDRAQEDQRAIRDALSEIRRRTQHVRPSDVHADGPQGFEDVLNGLVEAIRAHVGHEDEMLMPMLDGLDAQTSEELQRDVEHAVAHARYASEPPAQSCR